MQTISIFIIVLIVNFTLSVGCSKSPTILYSVPLCDCSFDQDNPGSTCLGRYVCDARTPCATANGQSDKCIPEESYEVIYDSSPGPF